MFLPVHAWVVFSLLFRCAHPRFPVSPYPFSPILYPVCPVAPENGAGVKFFEENTQGVIILMRAALVFLLFLPNQFLDKRYLVPLPEIRNRGGFWPL